ncbi:hypothetical protein K474DRAFT_1178058 [Panus rudis PR-1116 ss-1]|nr:hypothetical protein K474DRAFT_1178058 [Panus rudis PR-1116 ss-1]
MGAVLVGGLISVFFSGIVFMQAILYFRIYPEDKPRLKLMVSALWLLDFMHTCLTCASIWIYLIGHYGETVTFDWIPWTIGCTVALTALITFFVQCFFAIRIYAVSRGNWVITILVIVLSMLRLAAALVSTNKMIELKSYSRFVELFGWVFTTGLSTAAAVDIMTSLALCWYLNRNRSGFSGMDSIIDSITLYTVENGLVTSLTTVVSLACWISMPQNLIFLGLHLIISKLYANTCLATLNARKSLRGRTQASSSEYNHALPILFPGRRSHGITSHQQIDQTRTKVQVSIEEVIHRDVDSVDNRGIGYSRYSKHSQGDEETGSVATPVHEAAL